MPNYDYSCETCNHVFEHYQPITSDPLTQCLKCNGPVKRLIGRGGAVIFKGKGFHINDYPSLRHSDALGDN